MSAPRRAAVAATLGLACSTLAPVRDVTCDKDADCPDPGQVCSNGECYDNTLPPPEQLGLDIVGADADGLRVELIGTDESAQRIVEQKPVRYRARLNNAGTDTDDPIPGARDRLVLSVQERYVQGEETKTDKLAAGLELTQASRLRREPVKAVADFVLVDAADVPIEEPAVTLPWARYTVDDDVNADFPLVLTVRAGATMGLSDLIVRAPVHRQLVRKQLGLAETHTFEVPTRRECHRKLLGSVVVGDDLPVTGVVRVELTHSHSAPEPGKSVCDGSTKQQAVCSPDTIFPNELPSCTTANDCPEPYGCYDAGQGKKCGCSSDSECRTGQICDLDSNRCALDLLGLPATNGGVSTLPDAADFEAFVYTYCEDDLEAFRELSFVVRATPTIPDDGDVMTPVPPSPLPPLAFDLTVDFPPGPMVNVPIPNLCFPDWAPPMPIRVDLTSAPQEVYVDDEERPWVCCSSACLDQGLGVPPAAPASCTVTGELAARTLYQQVDPLANNCLPLTALDPTTPPDSQWVEAGKIQLGNCTDSMGAPTVCEISLSPGETTREWELRLVPPVGSLVRSMTYTAVVEPSTDDLPPPDTIDYRVLLRGKVALQTDPTSPDQCGADGQVDPTKCVVKAEILAERLRIPGEDPATILPPYFYTARTVPGGDFVLPVNPGVYLITAIPEITHPGGPAKISVLDLRLTSDLIELRGDVPTVTLAEPLLLAAKGQFVIFELDGFDFASTATPFDLSSWLGLEFEGRPLDLGDPSTCHGDPGRACSIRRLRPGNSGLALTQEQFVKFITRGRCERADAAEAPECQPPDPE